MHITFTIGYEGKKLVDEAIGIDITFQALVAPPEWNYRAVMMMTPQPGAPADDPPKARYFKNLRLLDMAWIVTFNKAMTVKGNLYQQGGLVSLGSFG